MIDNSGLAAPVTRALRISQKERRRRAKRMKELHANSRFAENQAAAASQNIKKLNADEAFKTKRLAAITKISSETLARIIELRGQNLSWRRIAAEIGGITYEPARQAFKKAMQKTAERNGQQVCVQPKTRAPLMAAASHISVRNG